MPTLSFFTGSHEDYHRPSDTADRVNAEGIDRVVRYATRIVSQRRRRRPTRRRSPRSSRRRAVAARATACGSTTGTIPDYASETKGLLLGGVSAGGPAEQAGLQKGDVIVEIAGQSIANVYDYTYALDVMKAGRQP